MRIQKPNSLFKLMFIIDSICNVLQCIRTVPTVRDETPPSDPRTLSRRHEMHVIFVMEFGGPRQLFQKKCRRQTRLIFLWANIILPSFFPSSHLKVFISAYRPDSFQKRFKIQHEQPDLPSLTANRHYYVHHQQQH